MTTDFKAETNIINKKSIILMITSILFTYLITGKKSQGKHKKKSKIRTFKKYYCFLDGIYSLVFTKRATAEVKKEPDDFVIENAVIMDL